MDWLTDLHATYPVAHAVGILALVCMAGMALGSVKLGGICLGTAGVLFAGIVAGHIGHTIDTGTLDFVKEFGLILFVFTMGLQLGPGFFAALRQQGLKMNLLAATIVVLGAVSAPLAGGLAGFDAAAVLGIFAGASVNMPSLGAATQTLSTVPGITPERLALPALATAVTFPTAIVASILTLLLLRLVFRVDVLRETAEFAARHRRISIPLERRTFVVSNPALDGLRLEQWPDRVESGVTISRVRHGDETRVATDATRMAVGDRVLAVGTPAALEAIGQVIGPRSDEDLVLAVGGLVSRRVVVTTAEVLGRSVGELDLDDRFGVAVTRIARADIELTAVPNVRLQFGDRVQLVGRDEDIEQAAAVLGNSLHALNETQFIPLFLGIFVGTVLGARPIAVPGLPQPIRLGLAGGPLIVALLLGRLGHIGPLVWHMPASANAAFREFGLALFFAAVGLDAGTTFFDTVFSRIGMQWMLAGAAVTTVPLLIVGAVARSGFGMSYVELSGLLAGGSTNPPALAFATNLTGSDAPAVAYATVYPLTMVLRILSAQVLALTLT